MSPDERAKDLTDLELVDRSDQEDGGEKRLGSNKHLYHCLDEFEAALICKNSFASMEQ